MSAAVSLSLVDAIVAACRSLESIAVAYMAPDHSAFVIQTVVGRHSRKGEKDFLYISPTYATDSETTREVWRIVKEIQARFPGVAGNAVSYVFMPGNWVEAYRR